MSKTGNTVQLHRVFRAPVNRVYRAFTEADAMSKWIAPFGFLAEVHQLDVRPGGEYRMAFKNFGTGTSHSFGGKYTEVKPNSLLKYTDKFDNPGLPGEIQVTIQFTEVSCGTEVRITQENLPVQIPVEMCYLGWQESFALLHQLVDPEIPDHG